MSKKKVLIVTGFFPYPTFFGGVFDIWERVKGLKNLGYDVDLLYTTKLKPQKKDLAYVNSFVNNLFEVKRSNKLIYLFYRKPLQVISRKELTYIHLKENYDLVILESENVGEILKNKNLKTDKIVLRVHNNESVYFKNLSKSTNNFFKKIYYILDSLKYRIYSQKVFNKVDKLWFISFEEQLKNKIYFKKSIHLPPPINQDFVNQKLNNNNVLFIGSLFMDNNIEAIDWYLNKVHNKIRNENYRLIICGSTGEYDEEYFEKRFMKYSNIELILNATDLKEIYSKSSIFINPMQHGAGVKIKSINAIVNGLPLISTTIGCEGIGLKENKMFYLANTPEKFREKVIKLLNSNNKHNLVVEAQKYLKKNHYITILKNELN